MRVVLDGRVATPHFAGIGRLAADLGHALAVESAAGGDIDMAFLAPPAGGTLPEPTIPCASSPFSLDQQWTVPGALARARADAYHSLYYLMPLTQRVPTLLSCMDLIPLVRPETQPAWKRAVFSLTYRLALARADGLVAISETTRQDLCERFAVAPGRVTVVPLAAHERFAPAPAAAIAALRRRHALPGPYLLYFGANKPHKNLVRLVEAFLAIAGPRPDIGLVVAGTWDPRFEEARRLARDGDPHERIRFLGRVDEADLPALYSGALAFAFPSLYEGFGLPVLEAMACGVPVVTSATSSLPEVAGDAALLVDPASTEAIADALARLCDDEGLRADLARRSRERAATFSWRKAARAHLDLYRGLGAA